MISNSHMRQLAEARANAGWRMTPPAAQFLARKNPPKGALRFLFTELAAGHWTPCQSLGQGSQVAAELLGLDGRDGITAALAPPATSAPRSSASP